MASGEGIALGHLEGVYPMLDLLQVGFLLIDGDQQVRHASAVARRLLGRRIDGAALPGLLGEHHADLVLRILDGQTWTTRWRDVHTASLQGDPLELAIRSVRIDRDDGARAALLALYDVSVEVALHRRYKQLLERQEAVAEELRLRIAEVLREHEDDHTQFQELLEIAPAIFASFVAEADGAIRAVSRIAEAEQLDDAAAVLALRESHTLKGNARGLGLNFIAGRAHAVEELIATARKLVRLPDRAELAAAIADLRRAIERAVDLRGGLGTGADATTSSGPAALDDVAATLEEAAVALPADHALHPRLAAALATVDRMARIPLSQLLHYLRITARTAAAGIGRDEPTIDVRTGDLAVPARIHAALQTALPHLVRNAVVHGLEPPTDRVAAGKPAAGVIEVEASLDGGQLTVRVRDDGQGIDVARLAAAHAASGDAATPASLADLVFEPGLSTRDDADLDAGRGMGAVAARDAIVAAGGELVVETAVGRGTTFTATLPISARARRARRATGPGR
jgi:two-component system, chemotaxis family, sensor kinase CheA